MKTLVTVLQLVFFLTLAAPAVAQTPSPFPSPTPVFDNNAKIGTTQDPATRMHWGSTVTRVERRINTVFLQGNAYLIRDNEEIHADSIEFNQESQFVKARGRVKYQYGEFFVKADQIDLDLKHKTGVITNGNLTNGTFALRGSRMEQIGEDRFLVKDYDYTTCLDCPNSWEITGGEVDFTIEGYAFIKDFMFKIKDASLIWFPYMIMPVKTKRQSGLLFPRFGQQQSIGLYFVVPAYWAINDWSDMTLGLGYFAKRGARLEWEGRYAISDRSKGNFGLFYVKDTEELANQRYRYAGKAELTQELPYGIEAKLRYYDVSDSRYPIHFFEDVPGRFEPALTSDLSFSRNSPKVSTVVSARRIRNLLRFDRIQTNPGETPPNYIFKTETANDERTVQELPRVVVNSNDQFLFGSKIAAGIEARFNRFDRAKGPFDYITSPGTGGATVPNASRDCTPGTANCEPIVREGQRLTLIPNLYTNLQPLPWLSVTPSVQYRAFFYGFGNPQAIVPTTVSPTGFVKYNDLARGYLLAQTELSAQLEKNYATDDAKVSYKHTIRPTLRYSLIPTIQESDSQHPFITSGPQQGSIGRYFDNNDIVPINPSRNLETYFPPQGNALTYGFVTQLFKRARADNGDLSVERRLEGSVTQTLDIQEASRSIAVGSNDNRAILSPFFANLQYTQSQFSAWLDYTYFSYLDFYPNVPQMHRSPHRLGLGTTWNFAKEIHDGVMQFERSFTMVYNFSKVTTRLSSLQTFLNFSINDYIMPRIGMNFDLTLHAQRTLLSSSYTVLFQSPSRCWRLEAGAAQSADLSSGFTLIFNFALNLTGGVFESPGI